jgi:hypothetical protein
LSLSYFRIIGSGDVTGDLCFVSKLSRSNTANCNELMDFVTHLELSFGFAISLAKLRSGNSRITQSARHEIQFL